MDVRIAPSPTALGEAAGGMAAEHLREAIAARGEARLLLATGASQIETLAALRQAAVDWRRVDVFHLDEYLGLAADHPASFRRYLREAFVRHVPLRRMHWIAPDAGPVDAVLAELTEAIQARPVDVALIGIGENGHLAFNDPPADFTTPARYHRVPLDERCRFQQVREGWFPNLGSVPTEAISMTVPEILRSRVIVVSVPYRVKAEAVRRTLDTTDPDPWVPASALHRHSAVTLFLDRESSGELSDAVRARYRS